MQKNLENVIDTRLQMNAAGMVAAVSDGRYSDVEAIYEFIDNSIDANSTLTKIGVFENNQCRGTDIERVVISDNGDGMNPAELHAACTLGGDCNRTKHDIGDFGIGMKGAAFALADKLIIVTKTRDGEIIGTYMSRAQIMLDGTIEPHGIPNPTYDYQDLWNEWSANPEHGTIIILESFHNKCGFRTGKAFADRLRDRSTLRSRYYYHLNRVKESKFNILVTDRNNWSRGNALEGYDRLQLKSARSSNDNNFDVVFDRSLRLSKYNDLVCKLQITEAKTPEARKFVGSTDHGLAIYYNGVLITISKDWLGTRPGNASWRNHIRGALSFDTKEEYEKVFSSAANKVSALSATGFGDHMAHKYFGTPLAESINRRQEQSKIDKAAKAKKSREQEAREYVTSVLGKKRTFPNNLLSYQSKISEIRNANLDDSEILGLLVNGVIECNMDNPEISTFLSGDSEHMRRFGRALAIQDAIKRDLRSSGMEMSSTTTVTFLTSLMMD